jgi:hypothetical protein
MLPAAAACSTRNSGASRSWIERSAAAYHRSGAFSAKEQMSCWRVSFQKQSRTVPRRASESVRALRGWRLANGVARLSMRLRFEISPRSELTQ